MNAFLGIASQYVPDFLKRYFFNFSSRAVLYCKSHHYQKIALYGAGDLGIEVYYRFANEGINVELWVDMKANTSTFKLFDKAIQPISDLATLDPDVNVLICSQATVDSMYKECIKQGVHHDRIVVLR
ncbi:hypothetical protein [Alteromonas facilis]|uniref:hypothetical protein n=1 Tax=Alteromonas facilis TaxID=2048004 RepID=UPI000C28FF73|nr:hypothetical protein [Alteromonas facilis]